MRSAAIALALVGACGDNIDVDTPEGDDTPDMQTNVERVGAPYLSVVGTTPTSLSLRTCAGSSGLPGGFTMQWMNAEGFAGWPGNFDTFVCDARFERAPGARFAPVPPYGCVTVDIGRLFDEEPGVSFSCDELVCATSYVFRAYGNATDVLLAGEPSLDLFAATAACDRESCGCTRTQGYWKNHESWPLDRLSLGDRTYTADEVLAIFWTPAQGNGLVALAHQLAAAKLNIAAGAEPSSITATMDGAASLIALRIVPPIGDGYLAPAAASSYTKALADFNEGATGPGYCDDD
jgi:hypothetical protein